MKTVLPILLSLLLHAMIFGVFSLSEPPAELSFRKGEIAMELLEPKDKKAAANKNGTLPATNSAQKSLPVSGIQSGSSLGIVAPEYPESSRIKGEEGEVIIAFTLDENEKLVSSQIEQSSGFEAIDKSAQKAVDTHYEESTNKVRDKTFRVRFKFQLAK